jgi:soluble lytic murein transglycosylase-like protein
LPFNKSIVCFQHDMKHINESFKNKMKAAALATALGTSAALGIHSGEKDDEISHLKSHPTVAYNAPDPAKDPINFQKKAEEKPVQVVSQPQAVKPFIDISIIADIESGNDPEATNDTGATGLCQIRSDTWKDETKKIFGKILSHSKAKNPELNKMVANHYYNVTLPKYLEAYEVPVNYATILASYNYGITHVTNLYRDYGDEWAKHLPKETKDYIVSYKNLAGIKE